MRRTINAKRAGPRFAVRFRSGMTVTVVLFGIANLRFLAPYATTFGQLLLLILATVYIGLLVWARGVTVPRRRARLFLTMSPGSASTAVAVSR
jgi:hypothetical protein